MLGIRVGYEYAHIVVAAECERLGGFFVGKKVFKCNAIEKASAPQEADDTND